jgi:2-polyprenyl-3-methyl-5-hydroxy-6-metoxy-1,4-benzoquinol methylase
MKQFLRRFPRFYSLLGRLYHRARSLPRTRIIRLSENQLSEDRYASLADPIYNEIVTDLLAFTGLSMDEVKRRLLRAPETHFESEFRWSRPLSYSELTWFYRGSVAYLFANAVHGYNPVLDIIPVGARVLDFGAGVGCNTIELAKRCASVDFLEIGVIQAEFVRFRADRHNLSNVSMIFPFHNGQFDPINCIKGTYDAAVAMDVLEHIPNYHVPLRHIISCLEPGGLIIENSPFDPTAGKIAIHVPASMPLSEAMFGMVHIGNGIWKKRADQI